ncbi:nucleoporin p54-like isoform X17 [Penaeus japonicus]|uniref:nucleoporin p54-like isoform X17 n=1 Tax=Penaeus japonicus TaxID=27405 RepID=UPI001C7125E7|nr:nucleoporin p54-like isoform X17 [Penaeus japonicus]
MACRKGLNASNVKRRHDGSCRKQKTDELKEFSEDLSSCSSDFGFVSTNTGGSTAPSGGGFTFGAANTGTTTAQGFAFGTATTTGTSTGTTGFSFGGTSTTGTSTAAVSTGFSFGGTKATPKSTAASTGFTFGNTSTAAAGTGTAGFSFGTTANPTTSASPFGATFGTTTPASSTATTQGFSFSGGVNQPAKGFSFGGPVTSNPSGGFGLLGSGFGAKPATAFPVQSSDVSQLQQGALGQPDPSLALHLAICTPSYFNNENDEVLRKWNQLQAFWGAGKGYYAPNMPPVEFTPENPYCRFKVVCYARLPDYRNEDGHVQVNIGKPLSEVEQHKQQIVTTLTTLFNGAEVVVEAIYAMKGTNQTVLHMHVLQPLPNGGKQKAPSSDVYRHMAAPTSAETVKNLCIQDVIPLVSLTEKQMREYLDTPQRGIDPALWEQGKRENPDPKKFFPVVKVGFQELQMQFKEQEQHAEKLQTSMKEITDAITQLKHKQAMVKAAIQNAKWKQANLTRRVLKLASAQEVERKRGVPLDQTEEQIRMRLEDLYVQLMQPTQYRGCLNELMAQMSVKPSGSRSCPRYGLVNDKEKDVSQYISWQQEALNAVVAVLKEDLLIADSMAEELQKKS